MEEDADKTGFNEGINDNIATKKNLNDFDSMVYHFAFFELHVDLTPPPSLFTT